MRNLEEKEKHLEVQTKMEPVRSSSSTLSSNLIRLPSLSAAESSVSLSSSSYSHSINLFESGLVSASPLRPSDSPSPHRSSRTPAKPTATLPSSSTPLFSFDLLREKGEKLLPKLKPLFFYISNASPAFDLAFVTLLRQIERNDSVLVELDLRSCILDVRVVSALAASLAVNSTLKTWRCVDNGMGDKGAVLIAAALLTCGSLTSLSLEANMIHNTGATALSAGLMANSTLLQLDLGYNKIEDAGADALVLALKRNLKILGVSLWGNLLSSKCLSNIHTLLDNRGMGSFDFSDSGLTDDEAESIPFHLVASNCRRVILRSNLQLTRLPSSLRTLDPTILKEVLLDPHLYDKSGVLPDSSIETLLLRATKLHESTMLTTRHLKLVVLGHQNAGKTALIQALAGKPSRPNIPSTIGLELSVFEIGDTTCHLIEYAGNLAETCFLPQSLGSQITRGAIFVIAFPLIDEMQATPFDARAYLRYWLELIPAHENPQVILIGTHLDRIADPQSIKDASEHLLVDVAAEFPRFFSDPSLPTRLALVSTTSLGHPSIHALKQILLHAGSAIGRSIPQSTVDELTLSLISRQSRYIERCPGDSPTLPKVSELTSLELLFPSLPLPTIHSHLDLLNAAALICFVHDSHRALIAEPHFLVSLIFHLAYDPATIVSHRHLVNCTLQYHPHHDFILAFPRPVVNLLMLAGVLTPIVDSCQPEDAVYLNHLCVRDV